MAESIVAIVARHMGSMIKDEANRLSYVQAAVNELRLEMMDILKQLLEAKQKGLAYNEQIRVLGAELRQIAYEAEDLVDSIALKVSSPSSSRLSMSSFSHVGELAASRQFLRELKPRMEDIKKKLYGCASKSSDLDAPMAPRELRWQPLEDQDYIEAIDQDVEKLIQEFDFRNNYKSSPCSDVLAIVGMGGSGKTTLAGRIYNHRVVKRHFNCQAWVTLTQKWDASAVLLDILRQAACKSKKSKRIAAIAEQEGHRLDVLESHLECVLIGKRCLIVLDDVWHSDSLSKILYMLTQRSEVSGDGSKIIITSRIRILSPENRLKWSFHETKCLSQVHSWELFEKVARKHDKKGLDKGYKVLGMEMLRRCQGLHLAIVSLANHLKTKHTIEEWEKEFSQIEGVIGTSLYRPVTDNLALSFEELPHYLKPCFLYLGIFPQGSHISVGMLVRMWIAEGFVRIEDNETTLEEAGRRCLKGLIDHTMVEVKKANYASQVTSIKVHDIMRDLCLFKSRELDFLSVFPYDSEINNMTSRRAAIDISLQFTLPIQNSQLRSLVLFGDPKPNSRVDGYVTKRIRNQSILKVIDIDICDKFNLLRVLDVSRIKIYNGTLPKQIGSLIHLKYLRMHSTNIQELHKSIGKLRNLLTFDYWDVHTDNEVKIPNVFWKLRSLRHLYLPNEVSRSPEDFRLHTRSDLQTLWGVRGGDWMIKEMNMWSFSLKKLYIHGIKSNEQLLAVQCFIKRQDSLYSLALDWYNTASPNLDEFFLNSKLRKLRLMGYAPEGLGSVKFPENLQKLELYYTQLENPETLEALGKLCSLRFLRLSKDSYVGNEWICSKSAFPKLEVLKVSNLKIKDWRIKKGSMPCLKKLSIVSCRQLSKIPKGLKYINFLGKLKIERMPRNFCSRLQEVKELNAIKHIPEVKIHDVSPS